MTRPAGGELSDWSLESETAERLRALVRRRKLGRVWPSEHSPSRLVLLAVLVGIVGGLGAVLFRDLIGLVHNVSFLGTWSFSYDANLHTAASPLGAWIIVVPVVGALVVAFIVKNFAPEAKGHGVPEADSSTIRSLFTANFDSGGNNTSPRPHSSEFISGRL